MKYKRNAFTLVELLATIIILAVILVIAVPKVMNIINDTKKSSFSNSVKLIASSAEQRYAENKVIGNTDKITCKDVAKLSSEDYKLCEITFEKDQARVTVIGDGKFDGLSVVYASKTNAEVQSGEPDRLYTFDDLYNIVDSLNDKIVQLENDVNIYKDRIEELENNNDGSSDTIENLQNQINEHDNKINSNTTEISNVLTKVNKNTTDISSVLSKSNSNASLISNLTNKSSSNNIFLQIYPVGSVYVTNDSANPGTKFGGTWVAYGAGRTLVGVDSSQEEFATVGKTGGEKTHILTVDEMPSHIGHLYGGAGQVSGKGNAHGAYLAEIRSSSSLSTSYGWDYAANEYYPASQSLGGSQPHNNLQPYITVYMWKRTA